MGIREFLQKMVSKNSGISSKRVCGVIGWLVCLFVAVFATICALQVPSFLNTVIIASTALLGVESITNIWDKKE